MNYAQVVESHAWTNQAVVQTDLKLNRHSGADLQLMGLYAHEYMQTWNQLHRMCTKLATIFVGRDLVLGTSCRAVYNRWTGLVDWTSGLDYWTDRFSFKTHI